METCHLKRAASGKHPQEAGVTQAHKPGLGEFRAAEVCGPRRGPGPGLPGPLQGSRYVLLGGGAASCIRIAHPSRGKPPRPHYSEPAGRECQCRLLAAPRRRLRARGAPAPPQLWAAGSSLLAPAPVRPLRRLPTWGLLSWNQALSKPSSSQAIAIGQLMSHGLLFPKGYTRALCSLEPPTCNAGSRCGAPLGASVHSEGFPHFCRLTAPPLFPKERSGGKLY